VAGPDAGDDLLEVVARRPGVGLGRDQLALGPGYRREDGPGLVLARVEVVFGQHLLDDGDLVGVVEDDEAAVDAGGRAVDAQEAGADRVERAQGETAG